MAAKKPALSAAQKAAVTRKRRAAATKAAATKKRRAGARKAADTRAAARAAADPKSGTTPVVTIGPPPGGLAARAYDVVDLAKAFLEARELRDAHEDLRDYSAARFEALRVAFGVDAGIFTAMAEDEEGRSTDPAALAWREASGEARLFISAGMSMVRHYAHTRSPFEGWYAAPRGVAKVVQPHVNHLRELAEATRDALGLLLSDLLLTLAPHASKARVTSKRLRELGFDDSVPGPDPVDYF